MYFHTKDRDGLKGAKMDYKYKIVIDNDSVWVDTVEDDPECVYTFTLYGYDFIHGLLNDMGINAEMC